MATIKPTITPTQTNKACVAAWAALANGDYGAAVDQSQYTDKGIQVFGTFGAGGALQLQGSNDGTNWAPLSDPQGNVLTITAAGIKFVAEATRYIRPAVTGGDGTTSITTTILLKE